MSTTANLNSNTLNPPGGGGRSVVAQNSRPERRQRASATSLDTVGSKALPDAPSLSSNASGRRNNRSTRSEAQSAAPAAQRSARGGSTGNGGMGRGNAAIPSARSEAGSVVPPAVRNDRVTTAASSAGSRIRPVAENSVNNNMDNANFAPAATSASSRGRPNPGPLSLQEWPPLGDADEADARSANESRESGFQGSRNVRRNVAEPYEQTVEPVGIEADNLALVNIRDQEDGLSVANSHHSGHQLGGNQSALSGNNNRQRVVSSTGGVEDEGFEDSNVEAHSGTNRERAMAARRQQGWGQPGRQGGGPENLVRYVGPENSRSAAQVNSAGSAMAGRGDGRGSGRQVGTIEAPAAAVRNGAPRMDNRAQAVPRGMVTRSQTGGRLPQLVDERSRSAGGRGVGRGSRRETDPIDALGRSLTRILRHEAANMGLSMAPDGFVLLSELLALNSKTAADRLISSHSVQDVQQVVAKDNKQRFSIRDDNGTLFIRANQGHSVNAVESDQLLREVTSPDDIPVCVHGTYRRHLASIFQQGLCKMGRKHIHFATGLPQAGGVISGMRSSCEVLIYLNVKRTLEGGIKLYTSENGVVLSEGRQGSIAREYFERVVGYPSMEPIPVPQ